MHHNGYGPHQYIAISPNNSLVASAVTIQRVFLVLTLLFLVGSECGYWPLTSDISGGKEEDDNDNDNNRV